MITILLAIPNILSETRLKIIDMLSNGIPQSEVAKTLHISRCAVQKNWIKFKNTGTINNLPKKGRPSKITPRLERTIVIKSKLNPFLSLKDIKIEIKSTIDVSRMTICRVLNRNGLKTYRAAIKSKLSHKHTKNRLKFAKDYKRFSQSDWNNIIFSDECSVKIGNKLIRYVRRPLNTRFHKKYVIKSKMQGGTSVMFWGAIFSDGRRILKVCPPRMDSVAYQNILHENLENKISHMETLMQDNAPIHRSKSTMEFLENKMISYIDDWPPNSPDINIIENMWGIVKNKLKLGIITNKEYLIEKFTEIWSEITNETIKNLYDSIPRRLKSIEKERGGHTKY